MARVRQGGVRRRLFFKPNALLLAKFQLRGIFEVIAEYRER
jgi:hypothetical protein